MNAEAAADRMPASAWVLAWTCLAGAVLGLLTRGPSRADAVSVMISVALSALVVGWVSAGVLQARPVRFWFAAILVGLVTVLSLVGVVVQLPTPEVVDLLDLALTAATLGALVAFSRTSYFRAHRADPARPDPALARLVLIAVVVGMLGGLAAPAPGRDERHQIQVRL